MLQSEKCIAIYKIILVFAQIASVSLFHENQMLVLSLTGVIALLLLGLLNFKKTYVIAFFLFGLIGASAEFFPVMFGAWSYNATNVIGLPSYLPIIWGTAAVVIINLSKKIGIYE